MESAPLLKDRWLWAGAIAFFTVATIGMRYAIHDIVRLTEIEPIKPLSSKGDIMICDDTEDIDYQNGGTPTIKLSTLRTLLGSPHENISSSARNIVTQRCCCDPACMRGLVRDFFSEDESRHGAANRAITYLESVISPPSWSDSAVTIPWFSRTIIRRLYRLPREQSHMGAAAEQKFWFDMGPPPREWAEHDVLLAGRA